jgi:hypothetical protein
MEQNKRWETQEIPEQVEAYERVDLERDFARRAEVPETADSLHIYGFEQSGVITDEELQMHLEENFPPNHVSSSTIESIEYVDEFQEVDGSYVAGRHYYTTETTGRIEVYPQTPDGCTDRGDLEETIAHEIGHNVHANLSPETQATWEQISTASGNDEYVSEYARTDIHEDFAESYAVYQQDPELLHEVSAAKYDFMRDQVYNGREYPTRQR